MREKLLYAPPLTSAYVFGLAGRKLIVFSRNNTAIAEVFYLGDGLEAEPTARLFAAAPDLLKLVRKYRDLVEVMAENMSRSSFAGVYERDLDAIDAVLSRIRSVKVPGPGAGGSL